MPRIRTESLKKYSISPHRFMELYHFCLQYNDWINELAHMTDTVKGIQITDMPMVRTNADVTANLASRRVEVSDKCRMIEQTAAEAAGDLAEYILKAVTNEGYTFNYMSTVHGMPCSRRQYYEKRRKFYWLLSQKK